MKFHNHVLGGGSASLTVRTEIGLGTIYKFIGAILKKGTLSSQKEADPGRGLPNLRDSE